MVCYSISQRASCSKKQTLYLNIISNTISIGCNRFAGLNIANHPEEPLRRSSLAPMTDARARSSNTAEPVPKVQRHKFAEGVRRKSRTGPRTKISLRLVINAAAAPTRSLFLLFGTRRMINELLLTARALISARY